MLKSRHTLARGLAVLITGVAVPVFASGQDSAAKASPASAPQLAPLIAHGKMMFQGVKTWLVASAEKMPEDQYSFKPAAEVRSFGQIVGHLADQNYRFCSLAKGTANPNTSKIEATTTKKAELVASLKESIAFCDSAYDALTGANALQGVKLGPIEHPRVALLGINVAHSSLHYGNLITYMRMKNVTPPSSEPGGTAPPRSPK